VRGADGVKNFVEFVEQSCPELAEGDKKKFTSGMYGLLVGAEAGWMRGTPFHLDSLLNAPAGKTPLIVINLKDVDAERRPWIIGQVLNRVVEWGRLTTSTPRRPRLGLFIDELAGDGGGNAILPGGNFRSFSGEGLKKILRQGRHWGVSLLCGTQSPRDVASKLFPNFNTRLIGKLSGEADFKAAFDGIEMDSKRYTYLKNRVAGAQQGRMYVVDNRGYFEAVKVSWLCTLHGHRLERQQFAALYQLGILKRANAAEPLTSVTPVKTYIHDLLVETRGRLRPEHEQQLKAMLQQYV
jgi:hypothetical protein